MGTEDMTVDPGNAAQSEAWDGAQGEHWAAHGDHLDRSMSRYHRRLMDEVRPGDRVLDVGCGNGLTTRDAARRGAGALGVDLSSPMIAAARRAAVRDGVVGVEFVRGDAQVHAFPAGRFDLAISRNGAMFFADPVAAFANIGRALKPGGRLALVAWQAQERNEFRTAIHAALSGGAPLPTAPDDAPGPFSLSDPARVRAVLGAAGFADVELEPLHEPMWVGGDVDEAYAFLSAHYGGIVADLDDEAKAAAFAALRADVAAHAGTSGATCSGDGSVTYGSASWLITAVLAPGR